VRRLTPPSIPAVIFTLLLLLLPIGLQTPMLNSDGDLARHLRHGRYMLEHRELIRHDPFSFTKPGAPVVGIEYGSQLLYAIAEKVGGLPGVAVLAGLLIGATYALLAKLLLSMEVDPLLAYATVAFAAVLGVGHWTARPHLFSYVALVLLMGLLERRSRLSLPLTCVLFFVWVNVHGGFIYGWILIGVYLAGCAAELMLDRQHQEVWWDLTQHYAKMLAVAVAITIVNPYGLALHRHLVWFVGQSYLFDNTAEFTSPDFHEPAGKIFLCALLGCLFVLTLSSRRPTLPRLFVICVGIAFGLTAIRNVPIFGLTALPLVALHLNPSWKRLAYGQLLRRRFASVALMASTKPWIVLALLLAGYLVISRGRIGTVTVISQDFDRSVFPVSAIQQARQHNLQGHLFSEFAWGGYVLYAWPEQKVFIDGGTDFYGPDLFRQYATIKRLVPGWRQLLARWDVSLLLLRRESSLAHEVARDSGWGIQYCDSLAVLMERLPRPQATSTGNADSLEARLKACRRSTIGQQDNLRAEKQLPTEKDPREDAPDAAERPPMQAPR
jgi:hypothetical protein